MMDQFLELRASEFPQLRPGMVYADQTGSALPPKRLIEAHAKLLQTTILGNPHSSHTPSATATELIMEARSAVLEYFNASPDEYEVIFTSGATGAIRLLGHYMFQGGELLLLADNHNSNNGLRVTAMRNGAVATRYAPIQDDLTIDAGTLTQMLSFPRSTTGQRLFIYPAKSNYTGIIHSLEWVKKAKERGWDVMIDAAAFVANNKLDLSVVKPDFVPISFYKMFGYPTGLGCLIIRKSAYGRLHKQWFAGGAVLMVSVAEDFYVPASPGFARFEDGTPNFAMIPAIKAGLEFVSSLNGVGEHAVGVATALYDMLANMGDAANSPVIYNPRGCDTVTFNVKKHGQIVDAWLFEHFANAMGVFVRTGCFCNPGVHEKIFGYDIGAYQKLYNDAILADAVPLSELRKHSGGVPIAAIRASFGYANCSEDVTRFAQVVQEFLNA
jgi:selenocysteine lyase/cysteine desulfurase